MVSLRLATDFADAMRVHAQIRDLDRYYPQFDDWWRGTVIPGLSEAGRHALILAEEGGDLAGVAVVKAGADENKIRCLRVMPEWRRQGLAGHLIERSLKHLQHDKPVISVAPEMMGGLSPVLVNSFAFALTRVVPGNYRPGIPEYWFNDYKGSKPQPLFARRELLEIARQPSQNIP